MADDYGTPVIIMNGASTTRVGFAGDQRPRGEFPTKISDVWSVRKEALEKIWEHAFHNVLGVEPEEHPVLMIERAMEFFDLIREKVIQIMFETFNVPAFFTVNESAMCVYGSGLSSGTVWVGNDSENPVISVYEGHPMLLYRPYFGCETSGNELTSYLMRLLHEKGYSLPFDTVRDIKEKLCYVALDFEKEMASDTASVEKSYQLPNGEAITIGKERFRCPEALFQPHLRGERYTWDMRCFEEDWALHEKFNTKRSQLDEELQKEVYSNILLSGGTTLIPGLAERLKKELVAINESAFSDVNIIVTPKGKQNTWVGGSKLASQTTFPHMYITKDEYNEYGPTIVRRKCF